MIFYFCTMNLLYAYMCRKSHFIKKNIKFSPILLHTPSFMLLLSVHRKTPSFSGDIRRCFPPNQVSAAIQCIGGWRMPPVEAGTLVLRAWRMSKWKLVVWINPFIILSDHCIQYNAGRAWQYHCIDGITPWIAYFLNTTCTTDRLFLYHRNERQEITWWRVYVRALAF